MKELDLRLLDYLDSRYPGASVLEQQAFEALLDRQDPELYDYLTGRAQPTTEEQRRVVDALRRTS